MTEKVEISKRLVLINSASSMLARLLNIGVLVWLQQYLLNRIDPAEYALYPVILSVIVFIPLFSTVLTAGLARFIVEACARDDERQVTQIVSSMLPLLLLGSLALLLLGGTFTWYVDRFLNIEADRLSDARIMLGLLVFLAAVRLPMSLFGVGLYVRQKFVLANIITFVRELVRVAILLTLLFNVSTRILWVVVATVIASMGEMIVLQIISMRLIPALRFRFNEMRIASAKKLMSFGVWQFVAQLANTIRTSADPIFLNKLATSIDVNSFFLGSLPLNQIQQGSFIVSTPLQPALTAMHATGSKQGLRSAYLRGGRYALWISLLIVIPLVIYRHEVLRLYLGEQYEVYSDAATVMMLLLALFPVAYGNVMLPKIAHATAKMRPLALRVAAMQLINVALTLYLVGGRQMGALGSALATFIVLTLLYPILLWPLGWRLADVSWRQWLRETMWPGIVPGLGATAIWMALLHLVRPDTWFMLGACAGGGVLCYSMILFCLCLQPIDRQDFAVAWAKLRSLWESRRR